jgi:two-component system CheB/CheR fusion protein
MKMKSRKKEVARGGVPDKTPSKSKAARQAGGTFRKPRSKSPSSRAAVGFPIVGVGASAGGLEAFTILLKHLPLDTGMGFVLVQHLDPVHASALTQLLSRATSLQVREVTNDLRVERNKVYVIPPNTNLGIAQGVLKLQPLQATTGARRSIDYFFESLAQDQHERAVGVILSGTASDGTLGLEAIKAEGGITFAQDDSAKHDSMPRSAIAAGCVDFVLSPEKISKELARIAQHPYVAKDSGRDDEMRTRIERVSRGARFSRMHAGRSRGTGTTADYRFNNILAQMHNRCGVDFSLYKPSTIQRRIHRRMILNKLTTLQDYAQFLRGNAQELDSLYSDLLISVTSFFRNPEAFEVLKRNIFPRLIAGRGEESLRIWVLGCSTGQEAYSMAMALTEVSDRVAGASKFQLFATDLHDALLDKARAGLYAKSLVHDISPERLRRFFVEEDGGYRICKPLRESVVFARQNLLSDPPFSRMDLISCRNLLIYVEPGFHQKVFPTFHYALKPKGFLFLGASESVGSFKDLFAPVDKKHRIYSRKPGASLALNLRRASPHAAAKKEIATPKPAGATEGFEAEINVQREADRVTLNRFAPTGVLVNSELQALQFRGDTSRYLKPPTGQASFNVLKMAREGLMLPLRAAISKAKKESKVIRKEYVRVNQNGRSHTANLEIVPLKNLKERCYLIFFEESERKESTRPGPLPFGSGVEEAGSGRGRGGALKSRETGEVAPTPLRRERAVGLTATRRRIAELEEELSETRDYLQSVQEQSEAVHEELQASNEEVTSANEELQSINEELETSKEELESANEELTTVNEEMTNRNAELNRLNSDLVNLQTSTHLTIILLGRDLTIRRFSTQAENQFNLLAADVGRPISGIRHNLDVPELERFIAEVIDTVREREREVRDKEGRWYSLRVRPYVTLDNKVDGAVLLLVDIDALKRTEGVIAEAREHAEAIIRTVPDPLIILDADLRFHTANEAFYSTFKVSPAESEGHLIFELDQGHWDIPKLRELLNDVLPRHRFLNHLEVAHDFKSIGHRTMLLNARTLNDSNGQPLRILLAIQDITERKRREEILRRTQEQMADRAGGLERAVAERTEELTATNKQLEAFVYSIAHDLRAPLRAMQGFSTMLVEEAGTALSEEGRSFAHQIRKSAQFMDALLLDLLDFSRVSQQRIELEPVSLERAVQSALSHLAQEIRQKSAIVDASGLWPPVLAHERTLGQVLVNLASNALKFVTPGVPPQVRLRAEEFERFVRVWVEDAGIGVAPEHQEQIFRLFTRLHGEKFPGTGVGLAMVQKGIERMGGCVGVESTSGRGSRFWFELKKA